MTDTDDRAVDQLRRDYGPQGWAIVGNRDGSVAAQKDGEPPLTAKSAAVMKVILHDRLWRRFTGRKKAGP